MVRPRYILEYIGLRAASGFLNALPYRLALSVGWLIAAAAFFIGRYRVRLAVGRIRELLGDSVTGRDARRIAWRAWRNFVFCAVDLICLPRVSPEWISRHVSGQEATLGRLAEHLRTGKGAVLACPHMGAWEMAGVVAQRNGLPIFFLTGRQKNPLSDAYINHLRGRTGIATVQRGSAMVKHVIRRLKNGGLLAFLPDVRVPTPGPPVLFFGRPANLVGGMAVFAKQVGVPVFPAIVTRTGWTRHALRVADPVWPDDSLDRQQDWQRITQAVFAVIEDAIRREPEQWFWINKRWIMDPLKPVAAAGGAQAPETARAE